MKVNNPTKKIDKRCFNGAPAINKIEKHTVNITTDEPRSGSSKIRSIESVTKKTGLKIPTTPL